MAARQSAPMLHGLGAPRVGARDLVIKVKYGGTLKRFNGCVNGPHIDHDLAALRLKIASAFKFSPDAEFILTYTDEDGDAVMLDDDNDLHDAAIKQKLNPLRISVQLKSSSVGAPQTKQQASNSRSLRSIALEDQLAQVKSAIDDALRFVPEQVPAVLANLSHDLRSRATSLAELLDCFAKMMIPSSNVQPSSGPADGLFGFFNSGPQTSGNSKIKNVSALMTGSASEPSDMQTSETSKALGLKSVLSEDPVAKIEQSTWCYPPVDSQIFTSSGGTKSDLKGSADTELKRKSDARSKGKSVISSGSPVSTTSHGAPTQPSVPAPTRSENTLGYVPSPTYVTNGSNGKTSGEMLPLFPPSVVYPPPPVVPPYNLNFGANGKTIADFHSAFPPPPSIYSPFKLNTPLSVGTHFPNPQGIYSTGSSHRDHMPSSLDNYVPNPECVNSFGSSYRDLSANHESISQCSLHRWIQCDGCGKMPIFGPRYKSNVKEDYDLCGSCFSSMGNEAEYTRLDRPASRSIHNWRTLGRIPPPAEFDSCFIKDVTVPDGTPMAPSTPFTKIWRMRNNGCTMWPFGTQLIWVGGDLFTGLGSVKLAISANGGLPVGQETDVAVGFLTPAKPGRYISYWRLALPSGQRFGQRVWVHIQVEQPIRPTGNKYTAAINLNLPPKDNSTKLKPFTIDVNSDPLYENYSGSTCVKKLARFHEPIKLNEPKATPSDMLSAPTAVEPVQIPITNAPASSAGAASASMPAVVPAPVSVPAPEAIPLPNPAPISVPAPEAITLPNPAPVSVPALTTAPVSVPTAPSPDEVIHHMEEKLLRELEHMGFVQADLNKEILRQNNYDLEQSVDDLCGGFSDWDPLLGELSEMDFVGTEMNMEAAAEDGGGSIKRLLVELLGRAKDR